MPERTLCVWRSTSKRVCVNSHAQQKCARARSRVLLLRTSPIRLQVMTLSRVIGAKQTNYAIVFVLFVQAERNALCLVPGSFLSTHVMQFDCSYQTASQPRCELPSFGGPAYCPPCHWRESIGRRGDIRKARPVETKFVPSRPQILIDWSGLVHPTRGCLHATLR